MEAPELEAHLSNVALIHPHLRVHAVENRRVVNEDILLMRAYPREGRLERPIATILLSGEARITAYDEHVWMSPGDIVIVHSKGAVRMRQSGDPYSALAFEWEPEFAGARTDPIVRLGAKDRLEDFRDIWTAIRDRDGSEREVARLLEVLASCGANVKRLSESDLGAEVPERMQALTEALDRILSRLHEQPMMRDLEEELGLSTRQLNRLIAEYNERYGFNAAGWIDTRNRRRLMIGATFMTVPDASAAYVSRVVGYQSHTAFARALRTSGMPAPSAIASEVEQIREGTRPTAPA